MTNKLIKIRRAATLNRDEEDIYINPAFITAVEPDNGKTRISYFAFTSFVATNIGTCLTMESVESIVRRINEAQ